VLSLALIAGDRMSNRPAFFYVTVAFTCVGIAVALCMHESSSTATMTIFVHRILIASLLLGCCSAQTSTLKVLPWNNHVAALSLTFDDSRAVHLDVAVPELNKRHLRATFFLIVSKTTRLDDWRRVQSQGHEIGNHSVSHEHAADLNKASEELQVEDAKKFLDSNFHAEIITFAYPYTEVSPGLQYWVKRYDFAARGGRGDGNLAYIKSDAQPDWLNLPSQPSYTKYDAATYKGWIDQDISLKAWTTLQIHGIGDPSTGFEPIPGNTFIEFLDYTKAAQARGLWVAPFGEVAAYFRAQKIFEAVQPQVAKDGRTFTWQAPVPFPHGVVLKIVANNATHARLYQEGRELHRNKDGVYSVSFDSRELVLKGQL
jgi:peptidoglycan/xylan/chitin deacetylase (PgdA/CDA1 family)